MTTFPPDSVPLIFAIASASAVSQFLSLSLSFSLSLLFQEERRIFICLFVRPLFFSQKKSKDPII